jgi:hypothetical protein
MRISKKTFEHGMKRLEAAFRQDIPATSLKIYFEKLAMAKEADFLSNVEKIIENDNFFPSIARLREIALPGNHPKVFTGDIRELEG